MRRLRSAALKRPLTSTGVVTLAATIAAWGAYAATGLGVVEIVAIFCQVALMIEIAIIVVGTVAATPDWLFSRYGDRVWRAVAPVAWTAIVVVVARSF